MAEIYVAEDDPDIRSLIEFTLTSRGHKVTAFRDGGSAALAVKSSPPDLLVLDVMMPKVDGFQVLESLHGWGPCAQMRVLVLTARSAEVDWARAYELGAHVYMTKPFDIDELATEVDRLLAMPDDELLKRRTEEGDRAKLLSQLEELFGWN